MCPLEWYFVVYFPCCFATQEINTKITLLWAHRKHQKTCIKMICYFRSYYYYYYMISHCLLDDLNVFGPAIKQVIHLITHYLSRESTKLVDSLYRECSETFVSEAIWRHHKPFSQWRHSFHMKAALPLAQRLPTLYHLEKHRPSIIQKILPSDYLLMLSHNTIYPVTMADPYSRPERITRLAGSN